MTRNLTKLEPSHLDLPNLSYTILNLYPKLWKTIKQNKMEKPTQLLGQPKETAAREQRWHGPDNGVAHARLSPQPRQLTRGARVSARQTGERSGRRCSSSPVAPPARSAVHRCSSHQCASSGAINFGYHRSKRGWWRPRRRSDHFLKF